MPVHVAPPWTASINDLILDSALAERVAIAISIGWKLTPARTDRGKRNLYKRDGDRMVYLTEAELLNLPLRMD